MFIMTCIDCGKKVTSQSSARCRKCHTENVTGKLRYPIKDRFLKYVRKTPTCWLWVGSKYRSGYGVFSILGKCFGAHRCSYVIFNGPIPKNIHVCHSCDTRACVNPKHLWLGTMQDNTLDALSKGRLKGFIRSSYKRRRWSKDSLV